jgi:predicted RNA-binding protein with PUA-like domain
MTKANYWLMKTEPSTFSYTDLETTGWTHWDGVRNHQAKKNLMAMRVGDLAFIYHSVLEKALVGLAKITQDAYPDPTDETKKWVAVRVEPIKRLQKTVSLQEIKDIPALANIALVRQGRLSVAPLTESEFEQLLKMAKTEMALSSL